jgi:hypothetical protein
MRKPVKTAKERAGERLVMDYEVKVTTQPVTKKTVKGIPSKKKIQRKRQSDVRMQPGSQ